MKINLLIVTVILILFACSGKSDPTDFKTLNNSKKWILKFEDPCTSNWQKNWFKDGLISTIVQDERGLDLIAGSINRNDAHHTVLWTKKSFKGDIKIEYNYTRTDSQIVNVNILYIQAQGLGDKPYVKNISKWNKLREIPTMSIYYEHMNPLHISYAAFPMVNTDPQNDYVRVRKYPLLKNQKFKQTEITPTFFKTGLFLPNVTYKITVIKIDSRLYFNVKGNNTERLFSWDLIDGQSPKQGRIGLRHMFTRSSRYKDFKVWTK